MRTLLVEDDLELAVLADRDATRWPRVSGRSFCRRRGRLGSRPNDEVRPGYSGLGFAENERFGIVPAKLRGLAAYDRTLIVVMTGRRELTDLKEVMDAGADDYWTKPMDPVEFESPLDRGRASARNIAERFRAEDALRESVERFLAGGEGKRTTAFTTETCPAPIGFLPDVPFWYSARFMPLLGFRDDEFPNARGAWLTRLHPEDRDRVLAAQEAHFRDRVPYDVEYRLATKSGEYRWFSGRGHAMWDAAGNPVRFAGAIRDITERKRIEEALRGEQRLLRQLLDVHERERQLFAYEIHDGLSQQITGSLMHLEASGQAADPNSTFARDEFDHGVRLLREAVTEARRLLSAVYGRRSWTSRASWPRSNTW